MIRILEYIAEWPINMHSTSIGILKTCQYLEKGGLAAAVGAEEHPELPRRDAERAILEHRQYNPPPRRHREPDPAALDGQRGRRRGRRGEHSELAAKGSGRTGSSPGGAAGWVGAAAEGGGASGEVVRHRRRWRRETMGLGPLRSD